MANQANVPVTFTGEMTVEFTSNQCLLLPAKPNYPSQDVLIDMNLDSNEKVVKIALG